LSCYYNKGVQLKCQTKKLINYSKYVLREVITEKDDKDLAQFIMEHIIIRAVSNFEELIMSIVFHSAIKQTDKVIKFFRKVCGKRMKIMLKT